MAKTTNSLNRGKGSKNVKQVKPREEMSSFETRWKYDSKMRGDGIKNKAPTTVDFFKVKID